MLVNALRYFIVGLVLGLRCLDNKSLGDLAGTEIGNLNNGTVVYKGMCEEMGFKLCRSDLVALVQIVSD